MGRRMNTSLTMVSATKRERGHKPGCRVLRSYRICPCEGTKRAMVLKFTECMDLDS